MFSGFKEFMYCPVGEAEIHTHAYTYTYTHMYTDIIHIYTWNAYNTKEVDTYLMKV